MKLENKSKKQLLADYWKWFSRYIRLRDCNGVKGYGQCISCGATIQEGTSNCQAGHYEPRGYLSIKFDESNVNVQCFNCNINLQGNTVEYRKGLVLKVGEEEVKRLEDTKSKLKKYHKFELIELINHYKQKVKDYENGII